MPLLAEIVDVGDLVNVVWTALVAGIGVCAVFSLAIIGFARSADSRREGQTAVASIYAVLMLVALAAVIAVVIFGVITMTSK
jgi:heme/copper-type cytochrome/quinol oxidase subunit 2